MTKTVFLDFETFFTTEYSLSRMTTREYILDPRFEVIGCSIAIDDAEARWYDGPDLGLVFAAIDWENCRVCAHNTVFDGAILKWKYDIHPKFWLDTMSMSQAIYAVHAGGASLKAIGKLLGMHKDTGALLNMRGVRLADIDKNDERWRRYKTYANQDVEMCRAIWHNLSPMFPDKELHVIDSLMRMYFDGKLKLDSSVIAASLSKVKAESAAAMARAGIPNKEVLRSRDSFAALLKSHGVTPPEKKSVKTGAYTYAFAKNDLEFTKLLDHPDPQVVALVEAKLNASSSIEETRAARFHRLSQMGGATLNVPLRYSAAHTHRFGGSDRLNLQNLPRNSPLRDAIVAPPGYKIVVVDASQIEARMLSWLAGCTTLTTAFAAGEDVYSSFASMIYGFPVNKKDHPDERFVGKTGVLGLGYGTGWAKFQWTLLTSPFYDGNATEDFSRKVVDTYRTAYPEVPKFWKHCDYLLACMARGENKQLGPLTFHNRHFRLPSGLPIAYPQLHYVDETEWKDRGYQYYSARYKGMKKIYGAALTENIIQALSRIVITDAMLYMKVTDPDYFCAMQVHDELVYLVPERKAKACYRHLMKYMCRIPSWANEDLPLAAEGGIGDRYGEIK